MSIRRYLIPANTLSEPFLFQKWASRLDEIQRGIGVQPLQPSIVVLELPLPRGLIDFEALYLVFHR
jgi:hypothetical protein